MSKAPREIAEKNVALFTEGFYNELGEENICRRLDERVVAFDYDAATLVLEFDVQGWMANPRGILHGGIYELCADMTSGALTRIICDNYSPTISMNVSFLAPCFAPDTLVVKAFAVHMGRTTTHVRTEITSKKTGQLLAAANAVHFVANLNIGK